MWREKNRYLTSILVPGRWLYVAWLFPIVQQRKEVPHPPPLTKFGAFSQAIKTQFRLHRTTIATVTKLWTCPHSDVSRWMW